jgi:hypothetical protein
VFLYIYVPLFPFVWFTAVAEQEDDSDRMNVRQFMRFLSQHRSSIWPVEEIQVAWMEKNLGRKYWAKKIEQYRVVREQEGLELM